VLSGAYFLSQEESFEAPVFQPLTIEHMKKELESKGFAVLPLEELKQIKENQLQDKQENLDSSDQELLYILF
jgi:(p)ppGpp synthase/HD superfamily hydrolase